MRLHTLTPVVTALALMLAWAAPTQAGPVITNADLDLIWESSDNPGATGVGTNAIGAAAGDVIQLGIFMDIETGGDAAILGISIEFDNDGGDELDLMTVTELDHTATYSCTPFPTCFVNFGPELSNLSSGIQSTAESEFGVGGGLAYTFEMGTTGVGPSGPISIKMGEIVFSVTSNVTNDGADVVSGVFNIGFDGSFSNNFEEINVTFLDAEVNTLPSPSTGLMALVSLGALALVARRR